MEKLSIKLDQYYEQFTNRWIEQKYIWKCVQTFQAYWDINADDLSSMIAKATIDADYLMDASRYYPREMIINLAKSEPEKVRKMFEILFNEELPVNERALVFNERADVLRSKYKGKCFRSFYHMDAKALQ